MANGGRQMVQLLVPMWLAGLVSSGLVVGAISTAFAVGIQYQTLQMQGENLKVAVHKLEKVAEAVVLIAEEVHQHQRQGRHNPATGAP